MFAAAQTLCERIMMMMMRSRRRVVFLLVSTTLLVVPTTTVFARRRGADSSDDTQEYVDFPPVLDGDDIAYFFEQDAHEDGGRGRSLHWALSSVFSRRSQRHVRSTSTASSTTTSTDNNDASSSLPEILVARGGGNTYTTAYKLENDLQQAEYLGRRLASSCSNQTTTKAEYFQNVVAPVYRKVLARIPPLVQLERTNGLYAFRRQDYEDGIAEVYNKVLHHMEEEDDDDDDGANTDAPQLPTSFGLLNPKLDMLKAERQWLDTQGIMVLDDVLSPEAWQRIRRIMLESTVWYQTKMPLIFGAYVGAYIDDGLHHQILLRLAHELHAALPRSIMRNHPLRYLWAYKYDSSYHTGINLHADQAAVNVNLWLTPDDANLDKDSGGLVVFTAKPPDDWDFSAYNTDTAQVLDDLIRPSGFANVTVPYRANRAVIFDSALFHHTDHYKFKQGYENKRINLTILYGNMQRQSNSANNGSSARTTTTQSNGGGEL